MHLAVTYSAKMYNSRYPTIDDLKSKAKRRIPRFAFEYLDGGCNENVNLHRNTAEIREIQLIPNYLDHFNKAELQKELFGQTYDAPFGISPIGLQGLIWPKAPEILAKASLVHNIPFILSTVSTISIERASELTEGRAWFQLYNPVEERLRNDIIERAESASVPVLVILSDVPAFAFRPNDIRNGLAMPPRMTLSNVFRIIGRPNWALRTLKNGKPHFATLKPYMSRKMSMKSVGEFMDQTFSGRLNEEVINPIRDKWKGKLVLKGVANQDDVEKALSLGLDGVIVSNHGGRQLDAGESSIQSSRPIIEKYKGRLEIMIDSGIRTGPDIARCLATGTDFTFLGRSFMYSVAALGSQGGDHMISMLKTQLQQVMEQVGCEHVADFPKFLAR